MIIAVDRRQAQVILGYIKGLLETPLLSKHIYKLGHGWLMVFVVRAWQPRQIHAVKIIFTRQENGTLSVFLTNLRWHSRCFSLAGLTEG